MTLSTSAVAVCCCSDSEILGARLHLVKQADVLDGDHRLVGEGRHQIDLPVGERQDGRPCKSAMTPIGMPSRNSGTPRLCETRRV